MEWWRWFCDRSVEELMQNEYILPAGKLFRTRTGNGTEIKSAKIVELGKPKKITGLYFEFNVGGIDIIAIADQLELQAYVVAVSASGPDKAEV